MSKEPRQYSDITLANVDPYVPHKGMYGFDNEDDTFIDAEVDLLKILDEASGNLEANECVELLVAMYETDAVTMDAYPLFYVGTETVQSVMKKLGKDKFLDIVDSILVSSSLFRKVNGDLDRYLYYKYPHNLKDASERISPACDLRDLDEEALYKAISEIFFNLDLSIRNATEKSN